MESTLKKPYLVLVGEHDYTTAMHEYLEANLPGLTIFVASNAVEAIQTMHQLDRWAIFIVDYDLPSMHLRDADDKKRGIAIDGLTFVTQNVRKTFRFDSFSFVMTDNVEVINEASKFKILCLRKSKANGDNSERKVYNLDDFFIGDIKYAIETLKELQVDPLTGILTQSAAMRRWERDFERARTLKSTTAFLLGDLNDLGWINNTYGHLAADLVIKAVANVFRRNTRDPYDFAARLYMGDELGLFMPETKKEGAKKVRTRIEEHLKDLSVEVSEGVFFTPAVSFGIYILHPSSMGRSAAEAYKKMFKAAEETVYRNKLVYYGRLAAGGDKHAQEKYEKYRDSEKVKS